MNIKKLLNELEKETRENNRENVNKLLPKIEKEISELDEPDAFLMDMRLNSIMKEYIIKLEKKGKL